MIKGGAKPTKLDHRDYSAKSLKFGAATPFPPEYNTDAGLTMPDQDAADLPYGCTDETTADLSTDLTLAIKDPLTVENITHANANGGADVRTALLAGKQLGWFTGIFNIQALDGQDFFDAMRDAMLSGGTEKRSVSVGTPWYAAFEKPDINGIVMAPVDFTRVSFTWHNWKICGWKTIGDQVYLVGKSWQGPNYANKGFAYFSRPLINNLMAVSGSAAFTATTGTLPAIQTITTTWLEWLMSYARTLLPY